MGSVLSLTACGASAPVKHDVDQFLPEGLPSRKKTIVFWHCLGQAKTDELEKVVRKFNADYSGYYEVKLDALDGDYSSLSSDVVTKLQAGEVAAMTMGYPDTFADLIGNNIEYSAILRLNNFIDDERSEVVPGDPSKTMELGYEYEIDPETGETTDVLDDFVPGYFKEGTGYQFEGVWSMPMYKSTEVLYYNLSYFSGANSMNDSYFNNKESSIKSKYITKKGKVSDVHSDTIYEDLADLKSFVEENGGFTYEIPETWQGLISLANEILDDYNGSDTGFYPLGYDSDANLMITQLEQRGYKYTTNENISKASDHFLFGNSENKANTKKLVDEIIGLIDRPDKRPLLKTKNTTGGSYSSKAFTEQKCVMSIGSTGGSTYQEKDSFVTALAPVPCYEDEEGTVHKKYIQQGPSICFFDNKDPYIHKGAWLFYKYMADPENNVRLALENSYDPIRSSSYYTTFYEDYIANAGQHLGLKYDIPAITSTLKNYYMTSPVFKGSATARDEIGNIITYVVRNELSSAAAIKKAYELCF